MITPSFSITATERVLPKLTLDFTAASLDGRITFTRTGNTATVTNSSGYVVPINADLPRFDYNAVTLVCKGLLIEESRINLLLRSEDFTTTWFNTDSSEQSNAAVSPGNTLTADKLVEGSLNVFHAIQQDIATVSATSYTFSVFAKYSERNIQLFFGFANVAGNPVANFDLQNGALGTKSGAITSSIENYGNGWYKCSVTATSQVTSAFSCFIGLTTSTSAGRAQSYQGNGTSGAFLWGAQLEAGASGTSYIPTVAATVTRNPDVATMTGTNFSNWWYASEGAAIVQALPSTISNTRPAIEFDDNTANESIALRGVSADPQLFVVDGGSTQATLDAGTITANTVYKLGGAWKASSFATAINGATAVTSASGTLPTVTQARLGSDGTNYFNGHLQNLRYWPQRLTNTEVQAFSK